MARGVNKVILIGNLGNDPEVRYTPSGSAVATISLATSETWKDKQSGELQDRTEWHRIVFFNRLAEIVGEYLRKGSKVYVEGSLRTRKWQDKNNVERYTTEIIANEMHMLDSKNANLDSKHANPSYNQDSHEPVTTSRNQNIAPTSSFGDHDTASQSPPNIDDDIPF